MSGYQRSHAGVPQRDGTMPRFHLATIEDPAASAREGRPIFRVQERVQFLQPGSLNQPVMIVDDSHKQRWPDQYEAWKKGREVAMDGTPIDQWPLLTIGVVAELKAMNIFTVDQCADMSDLVLQRIRIGGRQIKNAAIAYLDDAAGMKLTTELTRTNEELTSRVAMLEDQLKQMNDNQMRLHADLMRRANAPEPVLAVIPGMYDPAEQARQAQPMDTGGESSLAAFTPPRRGRPPNSARLAEAVG